MKFEYEKREKVIYPVAYIDHEGELILLGSDGEGFALSATDAKACGHVEFDPATAGAKAIFYPGDKLTITF
jgi:hypothetical protein